MIIYLYKLFIYHYLISKLNIMKRIKIFQCLVILSLFVFACSSKETPSLAAKKITSYLQNKEYEKYLDCMDSYEKLGTKEQLVTILKQSMEMKKGLKKVDILSESLKNDGKSAVVKLKYTYGDGSIEETSLNFKEVKDQWKAIAE
jgi:hypothetical protein